RRRVGIDQQGSPECLLSRTCSPIAEGCAMNNRHARLSRGRSLRMLMITSTIGCLLLTGQHYAAAEPATPSELQEQIDDVIPAPPIPPAAAPPHADMSPELAALWRAVQSSPTGDSIFDTWPEDLADSSPGDILEQRDVTATAGEVIGAPVGRAQLLKYRSTSATGEPSYGTATLVTPPTAWTGPGTRPVLVDARPINSLGKRCTPGYVLAHGLLSGGNVSGSSATDAFSADRRHGPEPGLRGPGPRSRRAVDGL